MLVARTHVCNQCFTPAFLERRYYNYGHVLPNMDIWRGACLCCFCNAHVDLVLAEPCIEGLLYKVDWRSCTINANVSRMDTIFPTASSFSSLSFRTSSFSP